MRKYKEGDWIIKKLGRAYNDAFKLNEETSLWYSGYDIASPNEVEKAVRSDVYWQMRMAHLSMLKEVFRQTQTIEQAAEWVDSIHLGIQFRSN